ncbi:MAG: tRNA (guanosine(46)-N7)-methyltransferase TrmB [Proteobacteria bacterium]|nr:tRNA (guanosine(46)-N7)-methyltransferase TrmB [Pseudomonadota bacterium]
MFGAELTGLACGITSPHVSEAGQRRPNYVALAPQAPLGAICAPDLLGGVRELELELGFGRGGFLLERARACRSRGLIGIELKAKWVCVAACRLREQRLHNVRVFHGDARELLPRFEPDACIRRAFVHFPDPWWKKRHLKRRLLGDTLVQELARLLEPAGELFVQTDVQERAVELAARLRVHPGFCLQQQPPDVNPYGARSNRERRAEQDGLPIYRVLARRT